MPGGLTFKGLGRLSAVGAATLAGAPFQMAALRLAPGLSRRLPVPFHRIVCASLGVRVHEHGARPAHGASTLIIANHLSWMDIPVIGSRLPVSFVSKAEVADWPGFGTLARLQRTVFVDRTRRSATGEATSQMGARLGQGESLVLFAEGTTGDGSRVLPFKSSLLGAVREAIGGEQDALTVQPLSILYRGRHGLPEGRQGRAELAWAGDAELVPHLVGIANGGPIDVELVWGRPIRASHEDSRKTLTRQAEREVRAGFQAALRRFPGEPLAFPLLTPDKTP
jgi:1-acyl-sn-glycerol-3-phosphate acyltransferase